MLTNKQMTSDIHDLSLISLRGIEDLVEAGLNLNEQDSEGNTYLHYCIKSCDVKLIETLCKAGANIYIKNVYRKSPVDAAWERSRESGVLEAILNHSEMSISCDFVRIIAPKEVIHD